MGSPVTDLARSCATVGNVRGSTVGRRTRHRWLRALLLASITVVAAGRSARAQQVEQFPVGSGCGPWGIVGGPDGNLWLTCSNSNQVKRISPAGAVVGTFNLAHSNSSPAGITTGPDGNLWFAEYDGNRMAKITTGGIITEFDLPHPGSGILEVAPGSDGNVWFTEQQGHRVGKITPAGAITEYADVGNPTMTPGRFALGPDGNLWVDEGTGNVIARVTPAGVFTDYTAPSSTSIGGVANGADGFMWFVEDGAAKVARIRVSDGHIDEFGPFPQVTSMVDVALGADGRIWVSGANSRVLRLHSGGDLQASLAVTNETWSGIAGPDGNVWFTSILADAVTRVDTASGFEDFPFACSTSAHGGEAVLALPDGSFWGTGSSNGLGRFVEYHPMPSLVPASRFYYPTMQPALPGFGMAADAGGALWFPDTGANAIVRQPTSGPSQSFPIPTANSDPRAVTLGSDGNFWFTEAAGHRIGRSTPQGALAEFLVPDNGLPLGITSGPDQNLWFADSGTTAFGRVTTQGDIAEFPSPITIPPAWIAAGADRIYSTTGGPSFEWMTTGGDGSNMGTTFHDFGVAAASNGEIWIGSSDNGLAEYRPETGDLEFRQSAVPLFRSISVSPITGVWYGSAVGDLSCDPSHPGVFGHLRWEIFVDSFESGNLWRWSTRSF